MATSGYAFNAAPAWYQPVSCHSDETTEIPEPVFAKAPSAYAVYLSRAVPVLDWLQGDSKASWRIAEWSDEDSWRG
jgi:hypothetical protein